MPYEASHYGYILSCFPDKCSSGTTPENDFRERTQPGQLSGYRQRCGFFRGWNIHHANQKNRKFPFYNTHDFNIGFQFMPHNYAREITGEHGEKYKHNPLWWYLGGPGSEIELKLAIGGIF
ncbi:MAG: hypothetical protein WC341_04635 [Bacteroidales bacterium]|jgi:hypothetical protein